jgi:hypothetical protein
MIPRAWMIWKRWGIYRKQAESFKLDDHGVIAVYNYLRTPGPVRLQWLELWMHATPTHHVSWHKNFMAMCYTVKDMGTLARNNLKEKNYFYMLLLHMILTCWAAIAPVVGADFCYHAIALRSAHHRWFCNMFRPICVWMQELLNLLSNPVML